MLALLFFAGSSAFAESPSADDILRAARMSTAGRQERLNAELQTEDGRTPFVISVDKGVVTYDFANPPQQIQMVVGADSVELRERAGGVSGEVKPARYDEKVRGSVLSYEDLALRFLYWPRAKLLGEETIRGLKCRKVEVLAPKGQSQYSGARVWISEDNGAAMRIEVYGPDGRIIKGFEVLSVQKVGGQWMLKTMRVTTYDPQTHKAAERTNLKVLGEAR